jgi:hypothetical protein
VWSDRRGGGPAVGWLAFRVDLADDPDPPEVIVFCPVCAVQEFGELPRRE